MLLLFSVFGLWAGSKTKTSLLLCLSHLPGGRKAAMLVMHTILQTGPTEDQRAVQAPEQLFPGKPAGEGTVQSAQQWQPL